MPGTSTIAKPLTALGEGDIRVAPKELVEASDDVFEGLGGTRVLPEEVVPVTAEVVPVPMDLEDVEGLFPDAAMADLDLGDFDVLSEFPSADDEEGVEEDAEEPEEPEEAAKEPDEAAEPEPDDAEAVFDAAPDEEDADVASAPTGLIDFDDGEAVPTSDDRKGPKGGASDEAPETESSPYKAPPKGARPKWTRKRKLLMAAAAALLAVGCVGIVLTVGGFTEMGGYDVANDTGSSTFSPGGSSSDLGEDVGRTDGSGATVETPAGGESLGATDIREGLSDLRFDGVPIGVNPADVKVTATDGQVLVSQEVDPRESFDYGATVLTAARGAAALANDLDGDKVDGATAKRVTWVVTDTKGDAKFTVLDTVGAAPDTGTLKTLLLGSTGYEIDGEWFSKLKESGAATDISARSGQTPTDLSGAAFGVDTQVPQTSASASASSSGHSSSSSSNSSSSSSRSSSSSSSSSNRSSSSSSSNRSSSSGSSSSSSASPATPTVTVTTPTQQQPQQNQQQQQQPQQDQTVETPDSSHSATPTPPQKVWVPEVGHMEPTYENVWVPEVTTSKVTRYVCDGCGSKFDSASACRSHQAKAKDSTTSHTVSETVRKEGGHYEKRQTGSHWVVDRAGYWK